MPELFVITGSNGAGFDISKQLLTVVIALAIYILIEHHCLQALFQCIT